MKREHQVVSQAVGVEQLRRREGDVIGTKSEHAARVVLTADGPVPVQVHGRFGSARAPRRPQPEGDIVSPGVGRVQLIRTVAQPLIPGTALDGAASDHVRCVRLPGQRRCHFSPDRAIDDQHTGAALSERVGVVGRAQAGARRHRDGANLHGAEVCGCELGTVRRTRSTRSSSWMPRPRRPWPTRLVNSARCRYVTRRSPHLMATLSPRPPARCRSTNAVARLDGRWSER